MKPILFNTSMVKAILDGSKTVTRRVVKGIDDYLNCDCNASFYIDKDNGVFYCSQCGYPLMADGAVFLKSPYPVGSTMYVRETWYYETHMEDVTAGKPDLPSGRYSHRYVFKADCPDYPVDVGVGAHGWRPSIHMPKEAARIFLRVTDVRVERLQDIDYEGCRAEGIFDDYKTYSDSYHENLARRAYSVMFAELWDSTIKKSNRDKYGWEANPYVFCVSFEKISKEVAMKGCCIDETY